MNASLLIGNGFNLTIDKNKYAVDKLLSCLNTDMNDIDEKKYSFSLRFEALISKSLENMGKQQDRKKYIEESFKKIKEELKELNKSNYNERLALGLKNLKGYISSIITTNYDFALEYNLFGANCDETESIRRNCGYKSKVIYDNLPIYHIHGDLNHPEYLCLGFLGYQKYNRAAYSNVKKNFWKPSKGNKSVFDELEKQLPESLYRFLTDDIYILGFSLDPCETIVWNIRKRQSTCQKAL